MLRQPTKHEVTLAHQWRARATAGAVHQLPPSEQMDQLLGGDGTAYLATRWLAAAGPSSLSPDPSEWQIEQPECNDRNPNDLEQFYIDGPWGCSPPHR